MNAEHEIRELLADYERAVNTGDPALAASCYRSAAIRHRARWLRPTHPEPCQEVALHRPLTFTRIG